MHSLTAHLYNLFSGRVARLCTSFRATFDSCSATF